MQQHTPFVLRESSTYLPSQHKRDKRIHIGTLFEILITYYDARHRAAKRTYVTTILFNSKLCENYSVSPILCVQLLYNDKRCFVLVVLSRKKSYVVTYHLARPCASRRKYAKTSFLMPIAVYLQPRDGFAISRMTCTR